MNTQGSELGPPDVERLAAKIRAHALRCCYTSGTSHIASGFSCADLLAVLYGEWLRVTPETVDDPARDRFILSKGHAAAIYYSTLAQFGFFPEKWLESYCQDGSPLGGHIHHEVSGVEASTGSLGHGLPIGTGLALGAARSGQSFRTVVLMSDGELDSGANWEAALLAAGQGLDNLVAIVDRNGFQAMGRTEDVIPLENVDAKWKAFGWGVRRIDGHCFQSIRDALAALPFEKGRPSVIVADTVKGKGVGFMEDRLLWHYKSPKQDELERALRELGES